MSRRVKSRVKDNPLERKPVMLVRSLFPRPMFVITDGEMLLCDGNRMKGIDFHMSLARNGESIVLCESKEKAEGYRALFLKQLGSHTFSPGKKPWVEKVMFGWYPWKNRGMLDSATSQCRLENFTSILSRVSSMWEEGMVKKVDSVNGR